MTEEEEAGESTVRVYWREHPPIDEDEGEMIEWHDTPPTGPLDGWHAVDVPESTWHQADRSRRQLARASEELERARESHERAQDRLWRDAGVGQAIGRTR